MADAGFNIWWGLVGLLPLLLYIVLVLREMDPLPATVICVVLREIAQKAVAERPLGVIDNIKSCFQKNTCVTCAYRYRSTITSKSDIIFSNRNEYITDKISDFLPVD